MAFDLQLSIIEMNRRAVADFPREKVDDTDLRLAAERWPDALPFLEELQAMRDEAAEMHTAEEYRDLESERDSWADDAEYCKASIDSAVRVIDEFDLTDECATYPGDVIRETLLEIKQLLTAARD